MEMWEQALLDAVVMPDSRRVPFNLPPPCRSMSTNRTRMQTLLSSSNGGLGWNDKRLDSPRLPIATLVGKLLLFLRLNGHCVHPVKVLLPTLLCTLLCTLLSSILSSLL